MAVLPQRPLRGSRISSFYPVKSLPSLSSLDSAFQLQEYISLLIRLDVHDVDAIVSLPGKSAGKEKEKEKDEEGEKDEGGEGKVKAEAVDAGDGAEGKSVGEDGDEKGKNDIAVDEACWIYEQLRRLAQDLTHPLITMLQQECTRASCPEMKAGEWLYLCVAHGNDGAMESCCAIDYILHTLDSATALLNTPRAFPSRLQIPQTSHRHFSSLARRLGRIFAHAYFHHREAFEQAEAESSLYARFLALTSKFDLVPAEFLVIPARTVPLDEDERPREREGEHRKEVEVQPPRLLAAAVDPRADERGPGARQQQQQQQQQLGIAAPSPGQGQGQGQWDRRGSVVAPPPPVVERAKSSSPSGPGSDSPRKVGRNRTDTMVLHEAAYVAEELAKADRAEGPVEEPADKKVITATAATTTTGVPPPVMVQVPATPDDLLSPIEDFPKTAKPRADADAQEVALPQNDNSLPESPVIKSPGQTPAYALPDNAGAEAHAADITEDTKTGEEPPAATSTVSEEPAPTTATAATETESAPEHQTAASDPVEAPAQPQPDTLEADISDVVVTAVLPMPSVRAAEESAAAADEHDAAAADESSLEAETEAQLVEAAAAAAEADVVAAEHGGEGNAQDNAPAIQEKAAGDVEAGEAPQAAVEGAKSEEGEKREKRKAAEGEAEALGVAAALIGSEVEELAERTVAPEEGEVEVAKEDGAPEEEPAPPS
ncbi:putative mob1 phocein [Lyophyllum shimeji]|uniref:Mob1 phocein n=1 Tax=Lyophyllum shimeji TaxID=47721 RepID=A0A9P3UPF2_LYOSH|nr:putative mob1 phocein [Lyophyllum shimeji]